MLLSFSFYTFSQYVHCPVHVLILKLCCGYYPKCDTNGIFAILSKSALAAVGPPFTSLRLSFASNTEQLQEFCAHCACTRLLLQYHVIFLSEYTIMSSTSFIMSTPMCHCGIVIFFKNQSAHVCAHSAVQSS